MITEIVLAEEKIEVRLPCVEVHLCVGELDRDTIEDGNITDGGRVGNRGTGAGGGEGAAAMGEGRVRHGGCKVERCG